MVSSKSPKILNYVIIIFVVCKNSIYGEQLNPSKILLNRIWTTAPFSPVAVNENTLSVPHLHAPIIPPAWVPSVSDLVTKAIYLESILSTLLWPSFIGENVIPVWDSDKAV